MVTQEELAKLHHEAELAMKKYANVVGVGYGFKETGGELTEQLSFCVYVKEKKVESELAPAEIIPADYKGIPTDVLTVSEGEYVGCEYLDLHSPLISGIAISSLKATTVGGTVGFGTLGFFGYLNGVDGPNNVVLVSNNHVLLHNGAKKGDTIYQPKRIEKPGGGFLLEPQTLNPIATIHDTGQRGDHPYQYPSEPKTGYGVDAASAKLKISISSWCNTNCGVSYKNSVRGLNIGGSSKIADVERVKQTDLTPGTDYVVYKVGKTTSLTKGKIIRTNAMASVGSDSFTNMIEIEATDQNCNGDQHFVEEGDSGAAIINANRKMIGLVNIQVLANKKRAFACHIHPVLDRLEIEAISEANLPIGPAGQTIDMSPAVMVDGNVDLALLLRDRFLETELGRQIFDVALQHRFEVVDLVNQNRPVMLTWHRNQGPAFLAHLINNACLPEHKVPDEIEGVTRDTLLNKMQDVLSKHGSDALRRDMEQNRELVFSYLHRFDCLHELAEVLNGNEHE